jgi:CBS domain-containing protein
MALILEDALVTKLDPIVENFMVRVPVCARLWEPISSIRRSMLVNAFSYLPFSNSNEQGPGWCLVADFGAASFLRGADGNSQRKGRLTTSLEDAIKADKSLQLSAETCIDQDRIDDVLAKFSQCNGRPVLVVRPDNRSELIGLVTPADLL